MWGSSAWGVSESDYVWQVFDSTAPTVDPVVVEMIGSEAVAETLTPADNIYSTPASFNSVVVDINTPETPKSGTY